MHQKSSQTFGAHKTFFAIVGLLLCLSTTVANAASIQWVLQGVVFNDGATASGSFFYDADTNTFSSISITTTGGSGFPGAFYAFVNVDGGGVDADSVLLVADEDPMFGTAAFNLNLDTPMTNAGGTIDIAMAPPPLAFESTCLNTICDSFFSLDREVIAGVITTTVVPVPGALLLFGSALGLLGWRGRTRDRATLFERGTSL